MCWTKFYVVSYCQNRALSTDQFVRFSLKREIRNEVDFLYLSQKLVVIGLPRLGTPKVLQNDKSGIYSKERYDQILFCILDPEDRESFEITAVCMPFTPLVGQFRIFLRSGELVLYFWIISSSYTFFSIKQLTV